MMISLECHGGGIYKLRTPERSLPMLGDRPENGTAKSNAGDDVSEKKFHQQQVVTYSAGFVSFLLLGGHWHWHLNLLLLLLRLLQRAGP